MKANDVLNFWSQLGNKGWWKKDANVDAQIHQQFGKLHQDACDGKLDDWAKTPDGALALIIVLDQFSRNMFRGDVKSFAQDKKALNLAKQAIDQGFDQEISKEIRFFFYMPFEHSEELHEQECSIELFRSYADNPQFVKSVLEHHKIIEQFGRFPHRNGILGRDTTPAEQAYLDGGGFKG